MPLLALTALAFVPAALGQAPPCRQEGKAVKAGLAAYMPDSSMVYASEEFCKGSCQESRECTSYTYEAATSFCGMYNDYMDLDLELAAGVVYGEANC